MGRTPPFLSPAWVEALEGAANSSDDVTRSIASADLTVQHVVTGTPVGEVRYWIRLVRGTVTTGVGDALGADVTLTVDHETARSLRDGEINAQQAFMAGRLKVGGNLAALLANADALATMSAGSPWRRTTP